MSVNSVQQRLLGRTELTLIVAFFLEPENAPDFSSGGALTAICGSGFCVICGKTPALCLLCITKPLGNARPLFRIYSETHEERPPLFVDYQATHTSETPWFSCGPFLMSEVSLYPACG
jgi:hypothetical protein